MPGEVAATQQSLPTKPLPYARQNLSEDLLTTRTPEAHQFALDKFRGFRNGGQFLSHSLSTKTLSFSPATMAARNGAVLQSIRKPRSSTSTPMTSPGPAL